jgi:diguanylate cyclase (GGDEF)-like protein
MTGEKFRVLLAEKEPAEAAESLIALYPEPASKLELSIVSTIPTLLATIEMAAPEAIFLDLSLGRPDPLDAVRRVHRAAPGIPLIVFAGVEDRGYASRSISAGAIDYLLKGFMDARTIERVLRTALERNTLGGLTDLLRDPLTGFYNREGLTTLGTRAMEAATRSGGTLVLLCALIENLSSLHKEFGPGASEDVLRETAGLLRVCFRRGDVLGRLGNAQFCALAIDAAEPSAPVLRQRVESRRAILNQTSPPWGPLVLRLSVGYWGANDMRTFAEFLDSVESELRRPEAMLSEAGLRG